MIPKFKVCIPAEYGWGNCGTDSNGRYIGYAHVGRCDHKGCAEPIDRGLSYVCGDMHGEDEISCERYFCEEHNSVYVEWDGKTVTVCEDCAKKLLESGEFVEDKAEGVLKPK